VDPNQKRERIRKLAGWPIILSNIAFFVSVVLLHLDWRFVWASVFFGSLSLAIGFGAITFSKLKR